MSDTTTRPALGRGPWTCPACGGMVRPEGATERQPVLCEGCGAHYRHPRMAVLLALAAPGLGSIYQRHYLWGSLAMALGTGAFVVTMWRIFASLYWAIVDGSPNPVAILVEGSIGVAVVMGAYVLDLAAVWWRRHRLVATRKG